MSLPTDSKARKGVPITSGVLDFFPDALAYVAIVSKYGSEKHNPGEPLRWSREKSSDHADCIGRHLVERGGFDKDGLRHSGMLAWRALANLQLELEAASKIANTAISVSDQNLKQDLALLSAHVEPSPLPPIGPLITPREPPLDDDFGGE